MCVLQALMILIAAHLTDLQLDIGSDSLAEMKFYLCGCILIIVTQTLAPVKYAMHLSYAMCSVIMGVVITIVTMVVITWDE